MKTKQLSPEEKLQQLEQELAFQKQRFTQATQTTEANLKSLFSVTNWIREYPLQAAALIMTTGVVLAQLGSGHPKKLDLNSNPDMNIDA